MAVTGPGSTRISTGLGLQSASRRDYNVISPRQKPGAFLLKIRITLPDISTPVERSSVAGWQGAAWSPERTRLRNMHRLRKQHFKVNRKYEESNVNHSHGCQQAFMNENPR